jgi:hypothetical protein
MYSQAKRSASKLNSLDRDLPEGLLVDARWLTKHGFSTSLRSQYVTAGRLEQPARRVYRRPRGSISWQQVVISLQMMLGYSLLIGGRTALELHGYAHYLTSDIREVHLYGPKPPPTWLHTLPLTEQFVYHNDGRLFDANAAPLEANKPDSPDAPARAAFAVQHWGQWDWPMVLSDPARAILELLDELPQHESFEQADKFMQGLTNLSPRRVQSLLAECHNVKVKRLFFFFADRHKHAWLKRLNRSAIDLGTGKRMLVKGGKLDPRYQITVPEDFHANP